MFVDYRVILVIEPGATAWPKSRSIDCWERGRLVRTERAARKTAGYLGYAMICTQRDADETSAFPAFTGLMRPKSTFLGRPVAACNHYPLVRNGQLTLRS